MDRSPSTGGGRSNLDRGRLTKNLDKVPRVGRNRRELANDPIFTMGIWAEEPSAQLGLTRESAASGPIREGRSQKCPERLPTTLEVGIDGRRAYQG